jgi:Asp-tRNA(Asn)/Glu-tRNA(Gln) amidotransferase A subunit family amidase
VLAELAAAVRGRRASSEELVRMSLERIERLDGAINAVVARREEEALREARAIDARVAAGDDPGPLAGLPLLVKDNEDLAGMPTTFGSRVFADAPAAQADCEVVARLRAAGAVAVGKTNLPELAMEGFTANELFGATRNPWAPEWSPGGSSGGSGAALMMGLAPLATGTDGGGSIRIPAAFCGFAGLKPTNGLVARSPIPSWIDLSTKGPMATSIADLRLLLHVLAGPAPGDPTAVPSWEARPAARPRRLLAAARFVDYGPLPEGVARSFAAGLERLSEATGLRVEPVEPSSLLPVQLDDDWYVTVAVEELAWVEEQIGERDLDRFGLAGFTLRHAGGVALGDYLAARRRRFSYVRRLDELVLDDAVIVTPTMCVEGFLADGRVPGADEPGTPASAYNTQIQNMTGHPALSVPAGVSANGVPFGLQITGPRFADDLVLAVGAAWEAAAPWPISALGFEPFAV